MLENYHLIQETIYMFPLLFVNSSIKLCSLMHW